MNQHWPIVPLRDVLRRTEKTVTIEPGTQYQELTVKLWGKGVIRRGWVAGAEIAASRRFLASAGNFVLSRIDARNGALGIVPKDLDGAIVSNDFPLFVADLSRLDLSFLDWMSRTAGFVELCQRASEGTTNRVRLQEDRFLNLKIALPRLSEQRRIVARIEELAGQVNEARRLRYQSAEQAAALLSQVADTIFSAQSPQARLDQLCSLITDGTHQTPRYTEDGHIFLSAQNVKPFRFMPEQHRKVSYADYRSCIIRARPQKGDVLLTRVGAGIGEAAVVDRELDFAFYVSLALLRPIADRILPEYLVHWLNAPNGRAQSRAQTLGKGHSQGNLNLKLLKCFQVPAPSLPQQGRIVAQLDQLQVKIDALKHLQKETASELDALLPAILDCAFRGEL